MLSYLCSYIYYAFVRRMFKWCLRMLTGKCELQRITDARHTAAGSRVFAVGLYFLISSTPTYLYRNLQHGFSLNLTV